MTTPTMSYVTQKRKEKETTHVYKQNHCWLSFQSSLQLFFPHFFLPSSLPVGGQTHSLPLLLLSISVLCVFSFSSSLK